MPPKRAKKRQPAETGPPEHGEACTCEECQEETRLETERRERLPPPETEGEDTRDEDRREEEDELTEGRRGLEEEEEEDDDEEVELSAEMRQLMYMMKIMNKEQRKREARRRKQDQEREEVFREILQRQQEQHTRALRALKPSTTVDPSIPAPRRIEPDQTIAEYLVGFKKLMKERGTPRTKWPAILPSLLNRKYNQALSSLDVEEADNYEIMKETLLTVDVEDLLLAPRKFFEAQKKEKEDFHKFCQKLEAYCNHITKDLRDSKDTKKMRQRMVMERFITFLPHQCATAVRDRKPETVNIAINYAGEYFASRQWSVTKYLGHGKWADSPGPGGRNWGEGHRRQGEGQRSYQGGCQGSYQGAYRGYGRNERKETQPDEQKEKEERTQTYKPPHRRSEGKRSACGNQRGEPKKDVTCFRCGDKGHYSNECRAKVDVKLLEYLDTHPLDKKLTTQGVVEGKKVETISLDTGADTSVVCSDLVPRNIKNEGTVIMRGLGSEIPCPQVVVTVIIKGRQLKLPAVVLPRKVVGRDVLLGKTTPGLDIDWWIRSIGSTPDNQPAPKESVREEEIPKLREEPGYVDIKVLTRAQATQERIALEGLEQGDRESRAKPTPLGAYCDESEESDESGKESDSEESESEEESEQEEVERVDSAQNIANPQSGERNQELTGEMPGNPYGTELSENPVDCKTLIEQQKTDPTLKVMYGLAKKNEGNCYYDQKGILSMKSVNEFGEETQLLVLPKCVRGKAFKAAHDSIIAGHLNYKYTLAKIRAHFYWPGAYTDVKKWCEACKQCQRHNPGPSEKAPLVPLPVVTTPWTWIALDIVGPLSRTKKGNKYLLTCIDLSTRYPVKGIETKHLIDPLFSILSQHGIPQKVLTDQGPQFISQLFNTLCDKLGVEHVVTTPYRPQSNGCLERFHRTFKACLAKYQGAEDEWDSLTPFILFALREAKNRSTGHSPFSLLYGRPVRGPASILATAWKEDTPVATSVGEILTQLRERLTIVGEVAKSMDDKEKRKRKVEFDKTAKAKPLQIGQQVLLRMPREEKGKKSEWRGPYTILDKPSEVTYALNTTARKRSARIFHRNCLKPYIVAVNYMRVCVATGSDEEGLISLPPKLSDSAGQSPSTLFSLGHLEEKQKEKMTRLLEENFDIFQNKLKEAAEVEPIRLHTTAPYPIAQKAYQVPEKRVEAVKEEIDDLLKQGVIRPSKSPWNSPVVIVPKPNGKIRLCVNYRALNKLTTNDPFPIPNIDDLIARASRCQFITTLDLTKGFHQVPVNQEDIPKTSFSLPWGKWEYLKMPFGIRNGPSHFQRVMTAILANQDNADVYIDDIVVYSHTFDQHLEDLKSVFDLLRSHKLRASPSKAVLCKDRLDFLGHTIGAGKISPQEAKISAFQSYQQPTTKRGVRSFLGATGFYRKFIQDYAAIASPLFKMTTDKAPERPSWTLEQQEAFQRLKTALTSESVLTSPRPDKTFILCTDASLKGVGAVLCQEDDTGTERPIAYFSKQLTPYQKNYSVTELELLAIVLAVEHFQVYLLGNPFIIYTDHCALLALDKFKTANGRLARWALFLQSYSYNI